MVVIILAIAGVIVVPYMLRGGQMELQAASRMVIADIMYAQNEAVARQAVRRVVFDPDENTYRITDAEGATIGVTWKGGSGSENYVVDFDDDSRFQGVRLDNAAFGTTTTLAFDDLGSPVNGGTLELATTSFRYRVTVADFTGQVTVEPVPGG